MCGVRKAAATRPPYHLTMPAKEIIGTLGSHIRLPHGESARF
jgi:hypothetical protein